MYVILGATGHTGRVVAEALLAKGEKIRAVGRSKERLAPLVQRGAEGFVADRTDSAALTRAFEGARAVYFMVPPDVVNPDYSGFQSQLAEATATALEGSKVRYLVSLSSFGAQNASGCGPISGLHHVEERLNRVPGLNVLHLRPGYFMENVLTQVESIKRFGAMGTPVRADVALPMIATQDIGAAAAEAVYKLDFSGHETRELHGQRDVTYAEATRIVGAAIGKPDLPYREVPREQFAPVLVSIGFSQNFAEQLLEMVDAINDGRVKGLEPRSARNTTPTSIETFVKEVFVPAFRGQAAAAGS